MYSIGVGWYIHLLLPLAYSNCWFFCINIANIPQRNTLKSRKYNTQAKYCKLSTVKHIYTDKYELFVQ